MSVHCTDRYPAVNPLVDGHFLREWSWGCGVSTHRKLMSRDIGNTIRVEEVVVF
jgi:hypothetical protein